MANNAPWYIQRAERNGSPLPGAKLYAYVVNTTIPKVIYADVTLETPLVTPLVANGDGLYPQYFLGSGEYTFVETDANDVQNGDPRNYVSATGGGGGIVPAPTDPFSAAIESFKEGKINWISDPDSDIFRDDGCFCWIIPAKNILTINWFKTVSAQNANVSIGKFSIWAAPDTLLADGVKLYEGPVPDNASPGIVSLGLDCSGYEWIGVACDPGLIGGGIPIEQTGLVLPNDIPNSPRFFGYVGQHAHNSTFATFPPIYAVDVKYMMTRWMQLGATFQGATP